MRPKPKDAGKLGIILPLFLLFCPPAASAKEGFFLNPALYYATTTSVTQTERSEAEADSASTFINATLGYSLASGLLLGVKYVQHGYVVNVDGRDGSTRTVDGLLTAAGVAVGFYSAGFTALVSSMALQAPKKVDKLLKTVLSDGEGTQVDLIYFADLGGVFLGPQLTWRSFDYKKLVVDGRQPDQSLIKLSETDIQPYLSFMFFF